jgi:hypothetical protein
VAAGRTSYRPVMKTFGITAVLPAQDLGRAKAFYVEKVGLQALESGFLEERDGQVGLTVGDGVSQLFVYPARARSSGEFTQAVSSVPTCAGGLRSLPFSCLRGFPGGHDSNGAHARASAVRRNPAA